MIPEENSDFCLLTDQTYSYAGPKKTLRARFFRSKAEAGKYAFSIYDEEGKLVHHEYVSKSLNESCRWMDRVLTGLSKKL